MDRLRLTPIDREGTCAYVDDVAEIVREVWNATQAQYAARGHAPPWTGYLADVEGAIVGTCAFKDPPRAGRVEIAYFTFPGNEAKGIATTMAAKLVAIARKADHAVVVTAQTLPVRSATHRVLEKLGFRHTDGFEHAEDGPVWEWTLANRDSAAAVSPHRPPVSSVSVILRAAGIGDAPSLAALSAELGYPVENQPLRVRLQAIQADPMQRIFVAERTTVDKQIQGWIHGFVAQRLESDSFVEIGGLVVRASARRTGIGRKLVQRIHDWARAEGYSVVRVRCREERRDAHRFYESIGFGKLKTQYIFETGE